MARSDKVQFRREFKIDSGGYLGGGFQGFFVGDILSMHIDLSSSASSILVEGRVGNSGDWELLRKTSQVYSLTNIDLRDIEYVRVYLVPIHSKGVRAVLFGYDSPADRNTDKRDAETKHISLQQYSELTEIKDILLEMNTRLKIITGE